jgi:hypothetical protein
MRAVVETNPQMMAQIEAETFPGPSVATDDQIELAIAKKAWGKPTKYSYNHSI